MYGFSATLVLFFLVMDPLGNLPVFIVKLDRLTPRRYLVVVLRESLIALAVLLLFLLCGSEILKYLQISRASLELAGGIILFLIAIKLVFGSAADGMLQKNGTQPEREPFIVPLAIPLFAGPAAMSTAILVSGRSGWQNLAVSIGALTAAWAVSTVILLSGRYAGKFLGPKALSALESLMGLLLTTIAVEMAIKGIRLAFP